MIRAYVAIGALVAAFFSGWVVNGWRMDAAVAAAREDQIEASKALARTEAARLEAQAALDIAAQQLEDAAHADTDATGGLPRARVDRLRSR